MNAARQPVFNDTKALAYASHVTEGKTTTQCAIVASTELQEISQNFTLVPELYDEVVQKSGDAHLNLERLIHLGDSRSKKAQLAEHSPQTVPLDSLCSFTGSSDHALNTEHYTEGDITEH